MKKITILLMVVCAFFVVNSQAQTNSNGMKQTIYYYTFSGSGNLEELRSAVSKMPYVTESKIEYKEEKLGGQIRIIVSEKARKRENEEMFSILEVKNLLLKNNFQPIEMKFEPYSAN